MRAKQGDLSGPEKFELEDLTASYSSSYGDLQRMVKCGEELSGVERENKELLERVLPSWPGVVVQHQIKIAISARPQCSFYIKFAASVTKQLKKYNGSFSTMLQQYNLGLRDLFSLPSLNVVDIIQGSVIVYGTVEISPLQFAKIVALKDAELKKPLGNSILPAVEAAGYLQITQSSEPGLMVEWKKPEVLRIEFEKIENAPVGTRQIVPKRRNNNNLPSPVPVSSLGNNRFGPLTSPPPVAQSVCRILRLCKINMKNSEDGHPITLTSSYSVSTPPLCLDLTNE